MIRSTIAIMLGRNDVDATPFERDDAGMRLQYVLYFKKTYRT